MIGQNTDQNANKLMAAYHYAVVCTGNEIPSSAILTYPVNEFRIQEYNLLLKLMPCINWGDELIKPSEFDSTIVEGFPGGIQATIYYKEIRMMLRISPLLAGRGASFWKGAVLYEVETEPSNEVLVFLGGGETINLLWGYEASDMTRDEFAPLKQLSIADTSQAQYLGGKEELYVGLKTTGSFLFEDQGDHESGLTASFPSGSGTIMTAFSEDQEDLHTLLRMSALEEKNKVTKYYCNLLKSSIVTPEKLMNDAFASAIYNLEYSWLEPFGWGECLHHWLALWYMQVTAAAEWIGQSDRSKSSILTHGLDLFEDGAIPMFNPNHLKMGMKRRDWGGANTFWVWQVGHYIKQTGDKEFARQIIPVIDKVIQQTLSQYDPDGNQLISWGLQIGNQEDFVANPYEGSVPTMELYNMLITRAELAEFTGDTNASEQWLLKAEEVRNSLYKNLWIKNLGRFAYYSDPTGRRLPDGQYQTYLYPAIYNLVDIYDQYSGIRHLLDRLTDTNGAVFASNNFAWHAPETVSTWGMQRGAAQQPWAAMGFAQAGMNNLTWKPLKAMANWAQDPRRPGAWPETGPEPTPAYFTPPAGLYISTVVEALFGLKPDIPKGYLEVSPSFPDHWPEAQLSLPGIEANYSRKKNSILYTIKSDKNLNMKVRWRLPVSDINKLMVNKQEIEYSILPGVGHMVVCFEVPAYNESSILIDYSPVKYEITAPASIAEGEDFEISVKGAVIEKVNDRYGVLESYSIGSQSSLRLTAQSNLLAPYLHFHQLGQLNFSRRTFFMDCLTPTGIPFVVPVDLTILPRLEASSLKYIDYLTDTTMMQLLLRNNTDNQINGAFNFSLHGKSVRMYTDLNPRSEQHLSIPLPKESSLTAGENIAQLSFPGESPITVPFRVKKTAAPSQYHSIELIQGDMVADSTWNELRIMPGFPHIFFTFSTYGWPKPMEALEKTNEISVPQIPGLIFKLNGQNFVPLSHLSGKTSYKIELEKKNYRKLYMLVLPFVDNHDMFSEVARVSAYAGNTIVCSRTLSYPGDLDYWVSDRNPTSFASFRDKRKNPYELLPILSPDKSDWNEGMPPEFPQSKWWSSSIPIPFESCVMSIIEINLESPKELDYLIFETLGALPAFGIVAVTGEIENDM